jgi:hypothetical protein
MGHDQRYEHEKHPTDPQADTDRQMSDPQRFGRNSQTAQDHDAQQDKAENGTDYVERAEKPEAPGRYDRPVDQALFERLRLKLAPIHAAPQAIKTISVPRMPAARA